MANLAGVVDELVEADVRALPAAALADRLVELDRQIIRLQSAYLTTLEVFDRSGAASADHGSTQAWVRGTLHKTAGVAARDVHLARDLTDRLPATATALRDGEVSVEHAQLIASLKTAISPDALAAAEPHLVEAARTHTPTELRGFVTHVRHSYAPDRARSDDQEDYAARECHASTTIHGLGVGKFTLHAAGMETFLTALHALSKPIAGDDRTPAQRRADALISMADLALRSGELPITGGVKPHVTIRADLATLTGAPGAPAADADFGATLSTDWLRRFACDAQIARVVFGPAGEPVDLGRTARTFTPAQRRFITARDEHCVWPGCDAPPGWCDAHHRVHWADGGATDTDNGVLVCGRHHDRIHQHGHAIMRTTTGRYTVDLRPGSDPRWHRHARPHTSRAGPSG